MKVLLMKDIPGLGQRGNVVTVRDGHARNLLIPQGFARPATEMILKESAGKQERRRRQLEEEKNNKEIYRKRLQEITLFVAKKANAEGHLFAGVSREEVARELGKQGFIIRDNAITGVPLKTVGEHTIAVRVGEIQVPVRISIKIGRAHV